MLFQLVVVVKHLLFCWKNLKVAF